MELFSKELSDYLEKHTSPENSLLKDLDRHTHLKVLQARMLSGHLQGRVLAMITQMIQPQYILEIGTYTGYSALCLAEGLQKNGELHTIEVNEEMETLIRTFFEKSPFQNQLHLHIGKALEIIPHLDTTFDLAFIDADKLNYDNYFEAILPKIRPNGFILIDNVLWDGKVLETVKQSDKKTQAMLDFNQKIQADQRIENVLLPIRDGLMLVRKI